MTTLNGAHEPEPDLFLKEMHPVSSRCAVLEDDGQAGWLYLTAVGEMRPEKDAVVYGRVLVPADDAIAAARSGAAPPLGLEFASAEAVMLDPVPSDFRFQWTADGQSVVVFHQDIPRAMIIAASERGYSRAIARSGFYGLPWDEAVYEQNFRR